MAINTKAKTKKKAMVKKTHQMIDTATDELMSGPDVPVVPASSMSASRKVIAVFVVVLVIIAALLVKQGYVIATLVNGVPIFRWQVTGVLMNRFGKQVMERMVNEALIDGEAKKAGIAISQGEIDGKVKDITAKFGGMSLEDLLKYQGMTKDDFEREIRLQMTIEKLLGKDIQISDDDVANFIATNAAVLTATEPAALSAEARQAILSQKISEKFQTWFAELREKANIINFLSI